MKVGFEPIKFLKTLIHKDTLKSFRDKLHLVGLVGFEPTTNRL
jgi:hypothetical protein